MSILITGGCGYIATHTAIELLDNNYDVILADNFYNSSPKVIDRLKTITNKDFLFEEIDFTDKKATFDLFKKHKNITAVIHFAAYKAVGESVYKPLEYYQNNIVSTLNVLEAMKENNVKNFVFSSSATVYGEAKEVPVNEESFSLIANSPYGWTKVMIEQMLRDITFGDKNFNTILLRYFNPIGAHPSGLIGEDPNGIPNNLIPYIAQVAIGKLEKISVFGDDYNTPDGTGVRDYIHVVDLAKGHVAAIKKLEKDSGLFTYNLGTGKGYSVLEVIKAYEKACKKTLNYVISPRRAGDIASLYANPQKALDELGWKTQYSIDEMCEHSWNWQSQNPNGFKD